MDKDPFPDGICLLCYMGLKTVKLRRQHVHMVKTQDENTGVKKHKLIVCPKRNISPTGGFK
jgi:hypothetical protein